MKAKDLNTNEADENRDPISGAPGAHPVGTGVGAASGGIAGAAIGAAGGPVGAGIGMVAGAVAGGLAGKAVAEQIDPTQEDAYWRDNYATRPYVSPDEPYDAYRPAYRTGYENYSRLHGKHFDEVESDLRTDYEKRTGKSGMSWDKARSATRDAWHRLEESLPGDADRDGR